MSSCIGDPFIMAPFTIPASQEHFHYINITYLFVSSLFLVILFSSPLEVIDYILFLCIHFQSLLFCSNISFFISNKLSWPKIIFKSTFYHHFNHARLHFFVHTCPFLESTLFPHYLDILLHFHLILIHWIYYFWKMLNIKNISVPFSDAISCQ